MENTINNKPSVKDVLNHFITAKYIKGLLDGEILKLSHYELTDIQSLQEFNNDVSIEGDIYTYSISEKATKTSVLLYDG